MFAQDNRDDIRASHDLFQRYFCARLQDRLDYQTQRVEQLAIQCRTVDQFLLQAPALNVAGISRLMWVDAGGVVRAVAPNEQNLIDSPLSADQPEAQALTVARATASPAAGSIREQGGRVIIPTVVARYEQGTFSGAIVAWHDLRATAAGLIGPSASDEFDVRLSSPLNTNLYNSEIQPPLERFNVDAGLPVRVYQQTFSVMAIPTQAFLKQRTRSTHNWILAIWICTLVLMLVSLAHARFQRHAETHHLRQQLDALESLTSISAAVSNYGTTAETIRRLPEGVRRLLGMSVATVGLLDPTGKILSIVSSDGVEPPMAGEQYFLTDLASALQCVQTASLIAIHDVRSSELALNKAVIDRFALRAILQIPMIVHGRIIGVMFLGHRMPKYFTDEDYRLAWLWGAQVAVMLMSSQLYQQSNRALQAHQKLLAQRDALYAVNAAIYRPGTVEEILARIAELAPGPLEVDAAMVYLVADDDPKFLIAAAVTPPFVPTVAGYRVAIEGSKSQIVLAMRQAIVVEDGPSDPTLNPYLRKLLPCGSLIFVPLLRSDHRPLGVIVLMRKDPGPFRKDQLDLAELFSARAAAAIEMGRLYQQTRRDADTKAMLLRELNHRVKNNMASIVSLLSINEPDLSPIAKQWLDRAIERIRNLAQAHELFSGGLERVTLAQLIEQTGRSLAVVKPPGVTIDIDIQAHSASLRTDRAVSLAMALHELCFNGIVHGMGATGTLIIRTRYGVQNLVIVEVEDDGSASAPPKEAGDDIDEQTSGSWPTAVDAMVSQRKGTGIGLSLVRGLITRELRGHFDLVPTIQGGTVACCEFPLYPDEQPGQGF